MHAMAFIFCITITSFARSGPSTNGTPCFPFPSHMCGSRFFQTQTQTKTEPNRILARSPPRGMARKCSCRNSVVAGPILFRTIWIHEQATSGSPKFIAEINARLRMLILSAHLVFSTKFTTTPPLAAAEDPCPNTWSCDDRSTLGTFGGIFSFIHFLCSFSWCFKLSPSTFL